MITEISQAESYQAHMEVYLLYSLCSLDCVWNNKTNQ